MWVCVLNTIGLNLEEKMRAALLPVICDLLSCWVLSRTIVHVQNMVVSGQLLDVKVLQAMDI